MDETFKLNIKPHASALELFIEDEQTIADKKLSNEARRIKFEPLFNALPTDEKEVYENQSKEDMKRFESHMEQKRVAEEAIKSRTDLARYFRPVLDIFKEHKESSIDEVGLQQLRDLEDPQGAKQRRVKKSKVSTAAKEQVAGKPSAKKKRKL